MKTNAHTIFNSLETSITYLGVVVYLLVFFLICRTLFKAIYYFVVDRDMNEWYEDTKLDFSYTISISLTSILFLEILKLFYIKTARQILMVSGIILLKMIVNYVAEMDVKELTKKH